MEKGNSIFYVALIFLHIISSTLAHKIEVHEQYSRVATNAPLQLEAARNIGRQPIQRFDTETTIQQRVTTKLSAVPRDPHIPIESRNVPVRFGRQQVVDYDEYDDEEKSNISPKCPDVGHGLFPHPTDCAKFLNCHNGRTFVQDCGPGTLFNEELQVCDWPQNVNCNKRPISQYKKPKSIVEPPEQSGAGLIDVRHSDWEEVSVRETQARPVYVHHTTPRTTPKPYAQPGNRRPIIGMRQNEKDIVKTTETPRTFASRHQTPTTKTTTLTPNNLRKVSVSNVNNYNKKYYNNKNVSSEEAGPPDMVQISDALKMLLKPYMKGSEPNITIPVETEVKSDVPKNTTYYNVSEEQMSLSNGVVPQNREASKESAEEIYDRFENNNRRTTTTNKPGLLRPVQRRDPSTTALPPVYFNRNPKPVLPLKPKPNECEYRCANGQCIKNAQVCNGKKDCSDKSDEKQCDHIGYEVRLSAHNGKKHEGRLEVKVFEQWGYVCDDKFDMKSANVACKELGFPMGASELRMNSFYGPNVKLTNGNDTIFIMDEVECTGNENSLRECNFNGWGIHDCTAEEVVGVICKIPIMTCPVDYWLCEMSQECIPTNFLCDGVYDCSDQSDESQKFCNASMEIRLKDGANDFEGRVEVKYRGIWGTICDDDFGEEEAKIVCRQLGHEGEAEVVKSRFGSGTGPIWLDQVKCEGNETNIDECVHWQWGEHNCAHTEDVGVKCYAGYNKSKYGNVGRNLWQGKKTQREEDFPFAEKSSKNLIDQEQCGRVKVKPTNEKFQQKVFRGTITERGQHPWQASVRAKKHGKSVHWCGAVLISRYHLLTATHCLEGYPKGVYVVRIGDYKSDEIEPYEIEVNVEHMYLHEDFRKGHHFNNDIAILLLKNPVRYSDFVQPVCLPDKDTDYKAGMNCTISGWGAVTVGSSLTSNDLRAGQVPIQPNNVCKRKDIYGEENITNGMFCAGSLDKGVDACDGDSGGPLVCEVNGMHTLYGLVSWGRPCGTVNKPGVYVKVSNYIDWIQQKLDHSMSTYGAHA